MRFAPLSIVSLAIVAMLSLQMSGLHVHANEHGETRDLHGAHVHDVDSDGHDHSADVDVSVFDPGIVWSKLMPALVLAIAIILPVVWTRQAVWPPPPRTLSLRRRARWRPPLRAPPLSP